MAELPPPGPPDLEAAVSRPPASPPPPGRPWLRVALLAGGSAAAALLLLAAGLQRGAAAIYGRLKPDLERQLGTVLGHPLQLGAFQGLGWSGLELGPSRLLPLPGDPSSLRIARIGLSLDPISTLRRGLPVLQVSLDGVRLDLRRNPRGGYWQLGRLRPGQPQPRLDLRLRLLQPAVVRLDGRPPLLQLAGGATIQPHRAEISGQGRLQLPGAATPVQLRGGGNWRQQSWRGQVLLPPLALEQPARLLGLPGQLQGRASGRVQLAWRAGRPDCRGDLAVQRLSWRAQPAATAAAVSPAATAAPAPLQLPALALRCSGDTLTLPSTAWRWGSRAGQLALQAQWRPGGVDLDALQLSSGRSWLRSSGRLSGAMALRGRWQLQPSDLPLPAGVPRDLLGDALQGQFQLQGRWSQPRLTASLRQGGNPLLGAWQAEVAWAGRQLQLQRFSSTHLQASGQLPLTIGAGGLRTGPLALDLDLQAYPLARLSPVLGTTLAGRLDASGTIRGPLSSLTPAFQLRLQQPSAGPLLLAETWQGDWFGDPAGGGRLEMRPAAGSGLLTARLDRRWVPVAAELERQGGRLSLAGTPKAYRWQASDFPLAGLQVALGPAGRFQPLQGGLSGEGQLGLQPLAFRGQVQIERAALLGVMARSLSLEGSYGDRRFQARGQVQPEGGGSLDLRWSGRWRGGYQAQLSGAGLGDGLVRQLVQAWPRWRGEAGPPQGQASDLGVLLIDTLGGSVDAQLAALQQAQARLLEGRRQQAAQPAWERLERLGARWDLDARLSGPSLADTRVDATVRAHVWLPGQDRDQALTAEPLVATLQGPLRAGGGQLSLQGLPLALLALLTPVPAPLRGSLALQGRYRLGAGEGLPALALQLQLQEAGLADTDLALERGRVDLEGDRLQLDLALRAAGADSGIDLAGSVPLDPAADGVELRLSSRDDGLIFLSRLARPAVQWQEGSAALQLLVRGSLRRPIANGFLRLENGQLTVLDQPVQDLQATVLFDFEQLFLQQFQATVGAAAGKAKPGQLRGSGSLGLVSPQLTTEGEPARLSFTLEDLPLRLPRLSATAAGTLNAGGSLAGLQVSGELGVARGSLNVQPSRLGNESEAAPTAATVAELAEQHWNFQQPLVLYGPDVESPASDQLRALIPNLALVRFDDLRLKLGPDLQVVVPALASFQTEGLLRIDGPLDPSLQARGVVRLRQGRLGLFTTTFSLDPGAPNVAVFTPSLGLIPYLDITLRTRVSDSLSAGGVYSQTGSGSDDPLSLSLVQVESQGGFSSLSQLNLVRVYLTVSGPADRLADSITLRSTPPLPEDRLLALIGGNTLAGVVGAGAGAALATVVGQSLLSPVLGTLGDAFGQRLSLAIYPAYVNQSLPRDAEQRSQRVPPQLVLATELGLDISERFNASVLAAPNVDNVPPQLNLTVKASELINLQGSIDSEGAWQTQLQLFFRF